MSFSGKIMENRPAGHPAGVALNKKMTFYHNYALKAQQNRKKSVN
jgi:hypothetical protein